MISDYLSKEERFGCIKAGALAYAGHLDATVGPIKKEAAGVIDAAKNTFEAGNSLALFTALSAGVPLGVLSHVIGRRIAGKRLREEELKEKIRLYQQASDELATGLGGAQ